MNSVRNREIFLACMYVENLGTHNDGLDSFVCGVDDYFKLKYDDTDFKMEEDDIKFCINYYLDTLL